MHTTSDVLSLSKMRLALLVFCLQVASILAEGNPSDLSLLDPKKVRYFLYRKSTINSPEELNIDGRLGSDRFVKTFDPRLPTVVFTHGFQGSYLKEASQAIKDSYLTRIDVNLILVDYEPYNQPYEILVARTVNIGKCIADAVHFLIDFNALPPLSLHMIGHSMGAHITGFAANNIRVPVPRITGLDPAGPMFMNAGPNNRLSDDDAQFVDCIHTSTVGIGKPICTVDFFVNGGSGQPNCVNFTDSEKVGCDHQESFRYYGRSIATPEAFTASSCPDYKNPGTKLNNCSPADQVVMGYNCKASTKPGVYYVLLTGNQPSAASMVLFENLAIISLALMLCFCFSTTPGAYSVYL